MAKPETRKGCDGSRAHVNVLVLELTGG
jgi:hypothetical protein